MTFCSTEKLDYSNNNELSFLKSIQNIKSRLSKGIRANCSNYGLNASHFNIILQLVRIEYCQGKKAVSQVVLADLLDIEPISLSKSIEKMEQQEMVIRTPHPYDKRSKLVGLNYESEVVKNTIQHIESIVFEVTSDILKPLSDDEKKLLIDLLQKLVIF